MFQEFLAPFAYHRTVDVDSARKLHAAPLSLFDQRDEIALLFRVLLVDVEFQCV